MGVTRLSFTVPQVHRSKKCSLTGDGLQHDLGLAREGSMACRPNFSTEQGNESAHSIWNVGVVAQMPILLSTPMAIMFFRFPGAMVVECTQVDKTRKDMKVKPKVALEQRTRRLP